MNKLLKDIIFLGAIAIFTVLLFTGTNLISSSIILLIVTVITISIKNKELKFTKNNALFFIILFYILHLLGVLYSENKPIAYFDLEVKLSLIIFPLLLLFSSQLFSKYYNKILELFFIISSLFSFALLTRILIIYINTSNTSLIFYSHFSYLLHPSYYAMYSIMAIIIGVELIKIKPNRLKLLYSFFISLNIISVSFSDSKSGLISLSIVILFLLFSYLHSKNKKIAISSLVVSIIIITLILSFNNRMKIMLNVISNYKEIIEKPNTYKESTGYRILSWNAALQTIKENPIIGVGTGDIKPELIKKYKELDYKKNIEKNMNVHNQILETWLGQGIIGFIILLLVLFYPLMSAIRQKDLILQSFIILIFINFLFESMLNTHGGTIFFGFFYSFLVVKRKKAIS